MAPIIGGTSGIGAAFARSTRQGACSLHDPGGQQLHRAPAPMGEAGAATPAIEMTALDEEQECLRAVH